MGYFAQLSSQTKTLAVEAFGTFLLVAIGTSAITTLNVSGQGMSAPLLLLNIIAFSLPFGWLVYTFGNYKIGYFNPAITLFLWLRGQLTLVAASAFVLIQLASAMLASTIVALMYGAAAVESNLGAVYPATEMGAMGAVMAEAFGMMIVLAMVVKVTNQTVSTLQRSTLLATSLAIGQLLSIGVSGGALNPARAIAPQLAADRADSWWVYWLGPIIAVATVWLVQRWLAQPQANPSTVPATRQPAVEDATEQQNMLQQKARQALDALRRQSDQTPTSSGQPTSSNAYDLYPQAPHDSPATPDAQVNTLNNPDNADESNSNSNSNAPVSTPLRPSFADEEEEIATSAPSPSPSQPNKPASSSVVSFVNFDTPVDTTVDEDEK